MVEAVVESTIWLKNHGWANHNVLLFDTFKQESKQQNLHWTMIFLKHQPKFWLFEMLKQDAKQQNVHIQPEFFAISATQNQNF